MKYKAKKIERSLIKNNPDMLAGFKVNKYDREYQTWKREPLSLELITSVFIQKLEYIHYNPVSTGLCGVPEEYYYYQQNFISDGTDNFGILIISLGNQITC